MELGLVIWESTDDDDTAVNAGVSLVVLVIDEELTGDDTESDELGVALAESEFLFTCPFVFLPDMMIENQLISIKKIKIQKDMDKIGANNKKPK